MEETSVSKIKLAATALVLALIPGIAQAADGDPAKGANIFKKCKACHEAETDTNKVGPSLKGVVGRHTASLVSYADKYSAAMKAKGTEGMVWNDENLDHYLNNPKEFIPGNKMVFPGLKKDTERADVIAYLKSVSPPSQ
jgi:cytochrome c